MEQQNGQNNKLRLTFLSFVVITRKPGDLYSPPSNFHTIQSHMPIKRNHHSFYKWATTPKSYLPLTRKPMSPQYKSDYCYCKKLVKKQKLRMNYQDKI